MAATLLRNARIWDGDADAAFPDAVLIEGNRIKAGPEISFDDRGRDRSHRRSRARAGQARPVGNG